MTSTDTAHAPAAPRRGAAPLVAIRDLSKYYMRGDQVIPVLVDIDLDVAPATTSR